MKYDQQRRAMERAAAPALAAIEEDSRRAPAWLRPLFAAIRDLLFEPNLRLEQIQDAAGFADDEVWSDLREEVGQPPWDYIRDARLETAAYLLRDTKVSISEIGVMVGYNSPSTFRRPLQSFLGMPPSEYRRRAPEMMRRLEQAGPAPEGASTNEYWGRALNGELSLEEARELDAYLGRLAPASAPANGDDARWTRLRRNLAEGLADVLVELPFDDQRRLVRDAVWFPDDSFFEVLSERSVEAGQDRGSVGAPPGRPDRGVELALLASDSLAANGMLENDPERAALARERLAQARRRAGVDRGAL